jgi:hypothetical protein
MMDCEAVSGSEQEAAVAPRISSLLQIECLSPFEDMHLVVDFVRRGRIPSRHQINSGLFASHFFNINPGLAQVCDLVDVRFFSSKLRNPIKDATSDRRLVVLGVTGSADGHNRRVTTDFVIVVDRSGSMRYSLSDMFVLALTGLAQQSEPLYRTNGENDRNERNE